MMEYAHPARCTHGVNGCPCFHDELGEFLGENLLCNDHQLPDLLTHDFDFRWFGIGVRSGLHAQEHFGQPDEQGDAQGD